MEPWSVLGSVWSVLVPKCGATCSGRKQYLGKLRFMVWWDSKGYLSGLELEVVMFTLVCTL